MGRKWGGGGRGGEVGGGGKVGGGGGRLYSVVGSVNKERLEKKGKREGKERKKKNELVILSGFFPLRLHIPIYYLDWLRQPTSELTRDG